MRKLIFILSFFASIANAQQKITLTVGKEYAADYHTPLSDNSIVIDDGYYNAFGFPEQLSNGKVFDLYKKAGSHAAKGPMTLSKTLNGGTSWTEAQITVGGTPIECAALSMCVLSSGRIVIAYQDDELYTTFKFAYSDDEGTTFTSAGTISAPHSGTFSPSPVKMIVMPSGKIRCAYYCYDASGTATVGFINSTNSGATWSIGETIIANTGTGFGDERGHEAGIVITHNTGNDATCKMIAIIRTAGYYIHYKSSDGGATWSTDLVTNDTAPGGPYSRHLFYKFGLTPSPVDLIVYNGFVFIINGVRATGDYKLQYMMATPDDAFDNNYNGWSALTTVLNFNATTLGADVDCGYPLMFIDYQGKLWCHYYDVSTETVNLAITTDRVWIKQVKITDPL